MDATVIGNSTGLNIDEARFRWLAVGAQAEPIDPGAEVIRGLQSKPKSLPCRYFYDDHGSQLFEQICDTPEYYPTRTEQAILEQYAPEIVALTGDCELVELGSGSSRKTRVLLEAYSQSDRPLYYSAIDVSAGILKSTAVDLLNCYPQLRLCGVAGTYEQALAALPPAVLENRLLIFLGSTMGNLEPLACDQFLTRIEQALKPGEFFLLGIDLQKPTKILEAAYNDAQGITAAFNLNILEHLNQKFQGNFNLEQFVHLAFYNPQAQQIEMHLQSLVAQTVTLQSLNFQTTFQAGETIHTEISRKFHLPTLAGNLENHALKPLKIWTDSQSWFGLILCQRQCVDRECP